MSDAPAMAQAAQSVQKLAGLDVAMIVCYHGGVVADDAGRANAKSRAKASWGRK